MKKKCCANCVYIREEDRGCMERLIYCLAMELWDHHCAFVAPDDCCLYYKPVDVSKEKSLPSFA